MYVQDSALGGEEGGLAVCTARYECFLQSRLDAQTFLCCDDEPHFRIHRMADT